VKVKGFDLTLLQVLLASVVDHYHLVINNQLFSAQEIVINYKVKLATNFL